MAESARKPFETLPRKRRFEEEAHKIEKIDRSLHAGKRYGNGTSKLQHFGGKENLHQKSYQKTHKILQPLEGLPGSASTARGKKMPKSCSSSMGISPGKKTSEKNLKNTKDDLETRILRILSVRHSFMPRNIAQKVGLVTAKDVNPTLYRMRNMGLVVKATEVPPTWKLQKSSSSSGVSKVCNKLHNMDLRSRTPLTGNQPSEPLLGSRYQHDFEHIDLLGQGGFGVVFKAKHRLTKIEYAVKRIQLENSERSKDRGLKEVRALARINHPHVVRYNTAWHEKHCQADKEGKWEQQSSDSLEIVFDTQASEMQAGGMEFTSEDTDSMTAFSQEDSLDITLQGDSVYLYIQMELCRDKTLADWLLDHPDSGREEKLLYFRQIVDAVSHIHSRKLIHRDLKPSNIFFSLDEEHCLKIGDFGLVTAEEHSLSGGDGEKKAAIHTHGVGTELYQSPEQCSGETYCQKVDIYALGVIFLEMMSPFASETERRIELLELRKSKKKALSRFYNHYPCGKSFVAAMLADDPDKRPTAQTILESPLLKEPKAVTEASSLEY